MGDTSGAGTVTLPEHMSSAPVFSGVRVTWSLVLCVCFVDLCLFFCPFSLPLCCLFLSFGHCVVCSSVFWPLCCLFFFDMRIMITPLVSPISSYDNLDDRAQILSNMFRLSKSNPTFPT